MNSFSRSLLRLVSFGFLPLSNPHELSEETVFDWIRDDPVARRQDILKYFWGQHPDHSWELIWIANEASSPGKVFVVNTNEPMQVFLHSIDLKHFVALFPNWAELTREQSDELVERFQEAILSCVAGTSPFRWKTLNTIAREN